MNASTQTTLPPLNFHYVIGVLFRLAAVTVLLLAGMALLVYLDFAEQEMQGISIISQDEVIFTLVTAWTFLLSPFLLLVLMAEFEILLLLRTKFGAWWCVVLVPTLMGAVGAAIGYLLFVVDRDPLSSVAARMFVLGTALQFFLAGSFQIWFFQIWTGRAAIPTPVGWYGVALLLAGGFLGSMVAWQAPSPYIARVLEYYQDEWQRRTNYPTLPIDPTSDDYL